MWPILLTLVAYVLLGIAYYGWGQIALFMLRVSAKGSDGLAISIWLGWCATLCLFQGLNFFLPIQALVTVLTLTVGVVMTIAQVFSSPRLDLRAFVRSSASLPGIVLGILFLGAAIWIAGRGMLSPTNIDSGYYHFSAIRWINSYPTVPGLGNLMGRCAYNNSFFTYVAALNFFPYFGHGRSLANSFLWLLLIVTLMPSLYAVVKQPGLLFKTHPFRHLAEFLLLPFIAYTAISTNNFSSPSPDVTTTILQIVIFVISLRGIAAWIAGDKNQDLRVLFVAITASTAITVKLSSLGFAITMIGLALVYTWYASRSRILGLMRILVPGFLIAAVWMLRSVILTGVPLYPATIGYLDVDWAIPFDEIVNMRDRIVRFSRQPNAELHEVIGTWAWLKPWGAKVLRSTNCRWFLLYPLFGAMVAFALTALIRRVKSPPAFKFAELIIALPIPIGLAYWLITAPSMRFAHALYALLATYSLLLLFITVREMMPVARYRALVIVLLCVSTAPIVRYAVVNVDDYPTISLTGWQEVKKVPLRTDVTDSGLEVWIPIEPGGPWDSPLPTTFHFRKDLRLRTPGNLRDGFTVQPPLVREPASHKLP